MHRTDHSTSTADHLVGQPDDARNRTPSRPDHFIGPRLRLEWEALHRRADVVDQARSWEFVTTRITDLDELLQLAGQGTPTSPDVEWFLRQLVLRGRHDDLAARVVLQRIVPGLLAAAGRRTSLGGPADLLEDLVGAAWITIRTYDPARRPSCLAAALVRGAEHRAFKAAERRRSATEAKVDPMAMDFIEHRPATSSAEELATLLAEARAEGIDDADLELIRQLVDRGSPAAVAADLGVTARTVRNRRDRVTYRLRRIATAA